MPSPFGCETWQHFVAWGFMQADVVWLWPEWAWPRSLASSPSDDSICDCTVSSAWAAGSRWNLACGLLAPSFDTSCGSLVLWLHSIRSGYRVSAHEAFFWAGAPTSHQGLVSAFLSYAFRVWRFNVALEDQQAVGRCWCVDAFSEGGLSSLSRAQGMAKNDSFLYQVSRFFWVSLAPAGFAVSSTAGGKVHGPGLMAQDWGMFLMIEAKSKVSNASAPALGFDCIEEINQCLVVSLRAQTADCLKHAGALQPLQRLTLLNLFADAEFLGNMEIVKLCSFSQNEKTIIPDQCLHWGCGQKNGRGLQAYRLVALLELRLHCRKVSYWNCSCISISEKKPQQLIHVVSKINYCLHSHKKDGHKAAVERPRGKMRLQNRGR